VVEAATFSIISSEGVGQTETIQVIGSQIPGDLAHFLDGLRGGGSDLLKLLLKLLLRLCRELAEQRAVFDDQVR
jgi:hypothetical protein